MVDCFLIFIRVKFKSAEGFFQGLKCLFSDSPKDIFLFQEMEPLEAKRVLKLRYDQDERFNRIVSFR